MIITLFTIISSLYVLQASAADGNIDYGFCPGSDDPLYLAYLNVQPYPVVFEPNKTLHIRAHIDTFVEVPESAKVKVRIVREGGPTPVAYPCINETKWGPIGSCDYTGNTWLNGLWKFFCPDVDTPNDCILPLASDTYGQDDPYIFTVPQFGPDMDFLLAGTFYVEISVERQDGSAMFCVYFRVVLQESTTPSPPPSIAPTRPDTCSACLGEAGKPVGMNGQ